MRLPEVIEDDRDDIPPLGIAASTSRSTGLERYPDNQRRMWTGYYASVTLMDEQVGRILRRLDELGLTESTAIVFTSDHGYHLGDHMFWQKSNLHERVTRVPLIVSVPGKDASDTFPAFASGPEGGESPPVGDATATGDPQGVTPPKKT